MKKFLILIPVALIAAGCNTTTAIITSPNGQVQRVMNNRFAWSSEEYDFGFDTNGVWHARATKSNPDASTVTALTGLAQTFLSKAP